MLRKLTCCLRSNINRSESSETLIENNILNYRLGKVLGKGKFGQVHIGNNILNNRVYAIKKSIKENKLFSNELKYLRKLKHSSLIGIHDSFIYERHHYLVLDYYKDGDLFSYIKKHHEFDLDITRRIILNLIRPLLFLKQYKIAHLDIKPENYLVRASENYDYVLTDFGTMCEYKDGNNRLKYAVGTKGYIAPEIYNLEFNSKSDVWSFGQIILILITGNMIPYENGYTQIDIYDIIKTFKVDNECFGLLKGLLTIDSNKRDSIEDILDNRWIEEYYLR
jgi:serine/threonine protein kinase